MSTEERTSESGPAAGPDAGARRLVVFGKVPEPGGTKTRLEPALGAEAAAELYRAFLDDTVETARSVPAARELWVPRHPEAERRLGERYPGLRLRWQAAGDLGDRLEAAFTAAFGEGAGRTVVVGSDHPTLPGRYLERAFADLGDADVALGPTTDGGYYAIGVRREAWPAAAALFRDVPWSTPRVLATTRGRAEGAGLTVSELPEWYDVDEPRELDRLARDVGEGSATARVLGRLGRGGEGERREGGGR